MKDIGKGPWRSGPPPSVGWWPASDGRDKNLLRWWNGKQWSAGAHYKDHAERAAEISTYKQSELFKVEWRDRADWWPERSRT